MIKIEQSVIINRPLEQIWKFMSNVEENTPKWDRGVLAARITSDGPLGVGTTIETRRQFLGRVRVGKIQVSDWQPLRIVTFQAKLGQATATQSYILESIENGTKLMMIADLDLIGWWKWIAPLLVPMLKRDGEADLANLKRILENMTPEEPS
jgi:hypothetical protein